MATDLLCTAAADNMRLARSKNLVTLADGTYNLIRIPKYAFVDQIWFYVSQAYAGGAAGSATLGFVGNGETADPDGFMDATITLAKSTDTTLLKGSVLMRFSVIYP
jgi:hypothetical protein